MNYRLLGAVALVGAVAALLLFPDKNGHSLADAIYYNYRLGPSDLAWYMTESALLWVPLLAAGVLLLVWGDKL